MSATQAAWKRGSLGVGAGLVLLGVLVAGVQPASAAVNCSGGNPSIDSEEWNMLDLINGYHQANSLGPLSENQTLHQDAAWMVNDLGVNNYFSHTDSLGRSPYARAIDCGYGAGAGENLAAGSNWSNAQVVFDAWEASPGHNSNMLGAYYHEIGIARQNIPGSAYGWYWAASFGAGGSGGSTPTPTSAPSATPTSTPATATATPSGTTSPTSTSTSTSTPSAGGPTPSATPKPAATSPAAPPTPQSPVVRVTLQGGANLVTWTGAGVAPGSAGITAESRFVIYGYDRVSQSWQRYGPRSRRT